MSGRSSSFYREKGQDILLKGISSEKITSKYDKSNPLLRAFLTLTEFSGFKIAEIDEAALNQAADKIRFLSDSQNVRAYNFQLPSDWGQKIIDPFMVQDKDENWFVIKRKLTGYKVYDPINEEYLKLTAAFKESLKEEAVLLLPASPAKGISLFKMISTSMRTVKADTLIFAFFSILSALVSAVVPVGINFVLGTLIPAKSESRILIFGMALVCFAVSGLCVSIAVNRIKARIQIRWQSDFFLCFCERVLRMPSGVIQKLSYQLSGDMMALLASLATIISAALMLAVYIVQLIISYIQMRHYGSGLEAAVLPPVLIYILVCILLAVLKYINNKKSMNQESSLTAQRQELFNGMENIKGNSDEELFYYRYAIAYDRSLRTKKKSQIYMQLLSGAATVISAIVALMAYLSISQGKEISLASLMAFISALTLSVNYFGSIFTQLSDLLSGLPYIKRAENILLEPTEAVSGTEEGGTISGEISLDHVCFKYEGMSRDIIHDLCLHIKPGEHIGIVGGSGSGKSTLLRLMLGFEKPDKGIVSYDDYDMSVCDAAVIRQQFGVVLQDAQLISGSIKKNISLSSSPDMDRVKEAARKADILDDIEAMPMKFETIVSNESATISGGQKQRIVIARSLMNDPKILFFDEATSALDNKSQAHVQRSVDELKATCVIVAHRLSTIQNCDRIILLDQGRIAEEGSFEELMEQNGKFAAMARRNIL